MFHRLRQRKRELELGMRIRNGIHWCTSAIYPYARFIVPNFRAAHYFYIVFWVIIGSILFYPVRNIPYIDVLFFTGGASTQAGLNTIDTNTLVLYQQIVIYIIATLTTPIFIHGSLLFVRLYWFERHFDNIKERSKLNFKMRRNATLAAVRSRNSLSSTRLNTVTNQGLGFDTINESNEAQSTASTKHDTEGIRFVNLPSPRAKNTEIDPSDMYRSIAMLQGRGKPGLRRSRPSFAESAKSDPTNDDDDILVIKSPNEIENDDSHKPIFTRLQRRRSSGGIKPWKLRRKRYSKGKNNDNDDCDDDDSIDSEENAVTDETEDSARDDSEDSGDDDDDESEDSEVGDDDEANASGYVSPSSLTRAQSNLAIPSGDVSGTKFNKRSNTLEGYNLSFSEPKVARKKRRRRRSKIKKLRKTLTPSIYTSSHAVSDSSARNNDDEDDEEEDYDGDHPLTKVISTNYLSWVPTIGRNSTFVRLSEEQKEELGGVEYRAVKLLIKILLCYYVGFHILGIVMLLPWILHKPEYMAKIREQGISPTWWAFFTAQSAFNDLGITLTYDSMVSFNRSFYVMLVMSFFIVIGNTGFPILLRFIIWVLFKFAKPLSLFKESLGFLLDHPRRCFTLLFPSVPTWWLFFILVVLNSVDLVLFIILDFNNDYLKQIPVPYRVIDGLFQAFSTRTAGFSVIDLSQLHPAVQVSYMIMMYISVLPLAISIRRTNVYEEQSLGIYLKDENVEEETDHSPKTFIGTHLRNQLSFDLWYIFLGLFIICIAEGGKLNKNNYRFSVFAIMFEIISAYGTVGLSLGYPTINTSLSGEFTVISKLVMIAMMIRGRHRGLPYSLDRAIMLPDDDMERRDEVQEHHAIRRNNTIERQNTFARTTSHDSNSGRLHRAVSRFNDGIFGRRPSFAPTENRQRDRDRGSVEAPGFQNMGNEEHELDEMHKQNR